MKCLIKTKISHAVDDAFAGQDEKCERIEKWQSWLNWASKLKINTMIIRLPEQNIIFYLPLFLIRVMSDV